MIFFVSNYVFLNEAHRRNDIVYSAKDHFSSYAIDCLKGYSSELVLGIQGRGRDDVLITMRLH